MWHGHPGRVFTGRKRVLRIKYRVARLFSQLRCGPDVTDVKLDGLLEFGFGLVVLALALVAQTECKVGRSLAGL